MRYVKIVFALMLIVFAAEVRGQDSSDVEALLTPKQLQKYRKGDALIEKGTKLIAETDSLTGGKETKVHMRETDIKNDQADILIYDGYILKIKALEDYIEASKNSNPEISNNLYFLHSKLDRGVKEAHKSYGRSNRTPNIKNVLKHQEEAVEELKKILSNVEKELVEISKETSDEELIVEKDSVVDNETADDNTGEEQSDIYAEEIVTGAEQDVNEQQEDSEAKEAPEIIHEDKLFFAIQIMADRIKVTQDRLDRVYFGTRKISENIGDGWYRYKVGKFDSYSEAKSAMKEENIKGFIVAYKGTERIPVAEAIKIMGGRK
jgi:hypothetical protein